MQKIFKRLLSINLLIFIALISNAQAFYTPIKTLDTAKLLVNYSLTYQIDSTNPENIKNENYVLLIGNNINCFAGKIAYKHNMFFSKKSNTNTEALNKYLSKIKLPESIDYIYKNYPEINKITSTDHVYGSGYFMYTEDVNVFNWKIYPDTCTINGYLTQKATVNYAGRDWIAWFTTDIPLQEGPYKFKGLPGLILKIYDTQEYYIFEFEDIGKTKETITIFLVDNNYYNCKREDVVKAKNNFRINSIQKIETSDHNSTERIIRNVRSKNNPLELQ